jgi:hypothetical protein
MIRSVFVTRRAYVRFMLAAPRSRQRFGGATATV